MAALHPKKLMRGYAAGEKSDMPNEYVSEGVREVVDYRNVLDICICYFARQRFAIAISATF